MDKKEFLRRLKDDKGKMSYQFIIERINQGDISLSDLKGIKFSYDLQVAINEIMEKRECIGIIKNLGNKQKQREAFLQDNFSTTLNDQQNKIAIELIKKGALSKTDFERNYIKPSKEVVKALQGQIDQLIEGIKNFTFNTTNTVKNKMSILDIKQGLHRRVITKKDLGKLPREEQDILIQKMGKLNISIDNVKGDPYNGIIKDCIDKYYFDSKFVEGLLSNKSSLKDQEGYIKYYNDVITKQIKQYSKPASKKMKTIPVDIQVKEDIDINKIFQKYEEIEKTKERQHKPIPGFKKQSKATLKKLVKKKEDYYEQKLEKPFRLRSARSILSGPMGSYIPHYEAMELLKSMSNTRPSISYRKPNKNVNLNKRRRSSSGSSSKSSGGSSRMSLSSKGSNRSSISDAMSIYDSERSLSPVEPKVKFTKEKRVKEGSPGVLVPLGHPAYVIEDWENARLVVPYRSKKGSIAYIVPSRTIPRVSTVNKKSRRRASEPIKKTKRGSKKRRRNTI